MNKDLISVYDIKDELAEILDLAAKIKKEPKKYATALKDKSLGMIFEKPSTRTRISFEVAMTQLGGHALYLSPKDMQMGRGETIPDTAKVLSRFLDGVIYRAFDHNMVLDLAKNATIPVINALDNLEHPAQIVADLLTISEKKGKFKNLKFAYVGDGNNVANSLILGCAIVQMDCYIGCPATNRPNEAILKLAREIAGGRSKIEIMDDPVEAVKNADIIYTDVWVSMGEEAQKEEKEKLFRPYQVNAELVKHAKKDYIFMHCLPAHRGYEVTDEVVDSKNSVVFDEAENRLHAQKALLVKMIK